jgi:large subunit ribosomal protein L18
MPAAYLTGFLAGRRALEDGVNKAVIDIGLQNNQHGTRLYAALKGVVDAGIDTSVNEEVFPAEGRIRGEHIDDYRDTDIAANVDDVQEAIEDEV